MLGCTDPETQTVNGHISCSQRNGAVTRKGPFTMASSFAFLREHFNIVVNGVVGDFGGKDQSQTQMQTRSVNKP